jgi:hypothetical protein
MKCSLCEDCAWVCETHPGRPWEGDHVCNCGAAGASQVLRLRRKLELDPSAPGGRQTEAQHPARTRGSVETGAAMAASKMSMTTAYAFSFSAIGYVALPVEPGQR